MVREQSKESKSGLAGGFSVEWAGQRLVLLPDGALWWECERTLFVADTHFGKAATFRSSGIPVPRGTTRVDLDRLTALVRASGAVRLIVLGDLLHAKAGRVPDTMEMIEGWKQLHAGLDVMLVRGNHDVRAGDPPSEWGIKVVDEGYGVGPFVLRHHPMSATEAGRAAAIVEGRVVLCGHVHPALVLVDRLGSRARFKAFVRERVAGCEQVTLPAFGSFTGAKAIKPSEVDAAWVVVDGEVRALGRSSTR